MSMSSTTLAAPRPMMFSTSLQAGRAAARHWRLLLLWVLLSLLPAAVLAFPVWLLLGTSFDYSVHVASLARELDMVALADVYQNFSRNGAAVPQAALLALLLTLAISPFLTGMAISAARAQQRPGFGALVAGGLHEYPRMARMLLVALLPLALAAILGGVARGMADKYSESAVLASNAAMAGMAASIVMALLLLLAHASIDAGRAFLALDRRRTSALKGWWHGCKLLARHPLRTLGAYLPLTVVGVTLAALLTLGRVHVPHVDGVGMIVAFLLMQLVVLVLAWMRVGRLFTLMTITQK